jgi:hypothetical protein
MLPPPRTILPVLEKFKGMYLIWFGYYKDLPKLHKHSLGQKIDKYFIDIIEVISFASFLKKDEKASYIRLAIRKLDTLKVLLMILWETKTLDHKKYILLSTKLDEIGKMLGGWYGNVTKNSPKK